MAKRVRIIAEKGWNCDDILGYLLLYGCSIEDYGGEIVVITNLGIDSVGRLIELEPEA